MPFASDWLFWASEDVAPPDWPVTSLPAEPRAITDLMPVGTDITADQRLYLGSPEASGAWEWTSAMAPFIGRNTHTHDFHADDWAREERRRVRRGRAPPQRTILLYESDSGATTGSRRDPDEEGLSNLYFARTFTIDDVDSISTYQAHMEFSTGVVVRINGVEVLRHHIAPGTDEHGAMATPYWLPDHVNQMTNNRWEKTWMGLDPGVLREGENLITVEIYKRPAGGRRAMYFDMQLEVFREAGFTKTPWLQSLQHDSMTVMWETNVPSYGYVEYGPEGSDFVRVASAPELASNLHEIQLLGLEPDTRYFYRVHSIPVPFSVGEEAAEAVIDQPRYFMTSAEPGSSFTFVAYGDTRTQDDVHSAITEQLWYDIQEHDARFVVHTGDITTTGASWHQWQNEFFTPALPLLGYIPFYTSLGNHEGNHEMYYRYMSLPGNEAWYTFEFGDIQFFALNSSFDYSPGSAQLAWLETELANSDAIWKIAFFHHPPYACTPSRKPGDLDVQAYLVPVFEQHDVDLVLLGHDHLYGRSVDMNGVRYVISGGGGAPSYPAEPDAINEVCVREFHYCLIDVSPDSLRLQAIGLGGNIIDVLELEPD